MPSAAENPENSRLSRLDWRRWGPYLSERQWGTVREDYSPDGNFWDYFSFDAARSRAYRWGEDGIAGYSDDQQRLCLSLSLWNHRDRFLKERGDTGQPPQRVEDHVRLPFGSRRSLRASPSRVNASTVRNRQVLGTTKYMGSVS